MERYDSSTDQFLPNAAVVASDREIGRLVARPDADASTDVLTVALNTNDRQVDIPTSAVDLAASTVDRVVLFVSAADVTGEAEAESPAVSDATIEPGGNVTVPLVEEELTARTRERDLGSVQFAKRVETRQAQVTTDVGHEEVTVEHVSINQPIDAAPESRFEGDTLIIPVVEEVLITEKRLMLREEVHIRRTWVTESVTVEDTVRREVLDVDEG